MCTARSDEAIITDFAGTGVSPYGYSRNGMAAVPYSDSNANNLLGRCTARSDEAIIS
jgi:hypothetical protein